MTRLELLEIAKPILFNTEMVKVILDGRKTVTRRAIKNKDIIYGWDVEVDGTPICFIDQTTGDFYPSTAPSHYQVDDILYVRETWIRSELGYSYRADGEEIEISEPNGITYSFGKADGLKWHPSIFMPKEAARIFLRVTGVRIERLQDISDKDLIREGEVPYTYVDGSFNSEATRTSYLGTWNSTVKKSDFDKYGWDANPWVWVIEFERVEVE